eukprot:GHVS01100061.1.p1 GENE.GHVS01100061.1~~GHVS01100061.1.p1  ORF type:complete len:381 (-),score=43.15 GHVS01100061.1:127-1269(-)
MARISSTARFMMLPIAAAALLLFVLPAVAGEGVSDRLHIPKTSTLYKQMLGKSATLNFDSGMSVKLSFGDGGPMGVTALQTYGGVLVMMDTENVTQPALVIEDEGALFIRTETTSMWISFEDDQIHKLETKANLNDSAEADRMASMLIGENTILTEFGVSLAKHLVDKDSTFSNSPNENDWLAKGRLELIRYGDDILYVSHTGHKEFAGWLPVTYGVVQENAGRPHITVRIDSANDQYDITFERREIFNQWDFAAMFDGIACNRKRTAEALFEGPWESIEKYSKGVYPDHPNVTFITPLATHSLTDAVYVRLWEQTKWEQVWYQSDFVNTLHPVAEGFLQKGEGLEFMLLETETSGTCYRLICELDEAFGWNCQKWTMCN